MSVVKYGAFMKNSSSNNLVWQSLAVNRLSREKQGGHKSILLWFTGLSGAGKSTLSSAVEERLYQMGCRTFVLDGDNIRHGLCKDLGFSLADRSENVRRIGEVSKLFLDAGIITLAAFISPLKMDREIVKTLVGSDDFIEVYCKCSLDICEERDVKGIYKLARLGKIKNFTGIDSPYDEPETPNLVINTGELSVVESVDMIIDYLKDNKFIREA